jgi:phosphopantetheinyl transferase
MGSEMKNCAQSRVARERRADARPIFVEGWRKRVGPNQVSLSRGRLPEQSKRVEIWVAGTRPLLDAKSCLHLLTAKDWAALNAIKHPASRNSSIAARILLRLALSRTVDRAVAPAEWEFSVGELDRPVVARALPKINFSVSHVDQAVAVAVSKELDIGVDIESVDQDVADNVMAEFCNLDEHAYIRTLPEPRRGREFIRIWTHKEAYTKMKGLGHSLEFKTINLMPGPEEGLASRVLESSSIAQFESFYVSADRSLFHVSLAAAGTPVLDEAVELQIIDLVGANGRRAAHVAPSCG